MYIGVDLKNNIIICHFLRRSQVAGGWQNNIYAECVLFIIIIDLHH